MARGDRAFHHIDDRIDREPTRRTDPTDRTLTYVDRRGGMIDERARRRERRDQERAPRGRRNA